MNTQKCNLSLPLFLSDTFVHVYKYVLSVWWITIYSTSLGWPITMQKEVFSEPHFYWFPCRINLTTWQGSLIYNSEKRCRVPTFNTPIKGLILTALRNIKNTNFNYLRSPFFTFPVWIIELSKGDRIYLFYFVTSEVNLIWDFCRYKSMSYWMLSDFYRNWDRDNWKFSAWNIALKSSSLQLVTDQCILNFSYLKFPNNKRVQSQCVPTLVYNPCY